MSNIFSSVDTGVKVYRSRFNLSYRHTTTCDYGRLIPVMAKFCLPGDVWRCGANILVRYQPMLSPSFTRSWIKMRYFFVPLRLVEPNFEKVVTGSDNGHLVSTSLPVLNDFTVGSSNPTVQKNSFWDYLGIPTGINYKNLSDSDKSFLPASYWSKAYSRIWYDYFRDENLSSASLKDFEEYYSSNIDFYFRDTEHIYLSKGYFESCLPWQLKGVAPTFNIVTGGDSSPLLFKANPEYGAESSINVSGKYNGVDAPLVGNPLTVYTNSNASSSVRGSFSVDIPESTVKFDANDLRTMFAQTRVFERLARCGSRYTEYLRANFNVAPSDGTLQRAQYLGGFKQPIVCTEIAQTAQDGENAVGTLRGKGISSGGGSIKPYVVKEFGIIFGLMTVMPEISYSQGISREYTYKERFDFFNPSFQNLSEQEVRNAELYVGTDGKNSVPFGYQGYYNELRISNNINTSEMRDTLSFWNQGIHFTARPNLSINFLSATDYNNRNSFHKPFSVQDKPPIIVDCMNLLDVYRPMVRRPVPGLIDHN
ncbi:MULTISPECIES: major capsid protein [Jeotgalibaca]|uniref:major capsid protein n=1 Tax=Jeotgalibaca TaxID=1470540 RepID=UPI0035A13C5A